MLAPCHLLDVAFAQSREAGEEESVAERRVLAFRHDHRTHLVEREVDPLPLLRLEAHDATQRIPGDDAVFKCLVYASPEFVEV